MFNTKEKTTKKNVGLKVLRFGPRIKLLLLTSSVRCEMERKIMFSFKIILIFVHLCNLFEININEKNTKMITVTLNGTKYNKCFNN
jgi:hypothetical protein